ncbi:MAG: HPr family phosphocarrier protein [Nitrospinota bacterium]
MSNSKARNKGNKSRGSLTQIISEADFLPLVIERSSPLLTVLSVLTSKSGLVNNRYFFSLLHEAEKLEIFLYDHGVKKNRYWRFYAELVASTRNYALAGFHISHAVTRYLEYFADEKIKVADKFQVATEEVVNYITVSLTSFYKVMLTELQSRGIVVEQAAKISADWSQAITSQLPYTIEGEADQDDAQRVNSICQSYRSIVKSYQNQRLHQRLKVGSLDKLVPHIINETALADFQSKLHNVQSEYDTYISGGKLESSNSDLVKLRGLIAVPMHILESTRWLVHFYERHEGEVRKYDDRADISQIASNEELFEVIVNYALKYCSKFMSQGNLLAEKLLSLLMTKDRITLAVPDPNGFHARPATYLSLVTKEYGLDIFMYVDNRKFDCRSVLEIMEAGGILSETGQKKVVFESCKSVLGDLKILADHNWCEDQNIPPELNYIRILRNI